MSNERLKIILHEIFISMRQIFGSNLSEVILYGSYARGENVDGSDIDVMVLVDLDNNKLSEYRSQISEVSWRLGMEHDVLISISLDNNTFFHDWKDDMPFYRNVWNEGLKINA